MRIRIDFPGLVQQPSQGRNEGSIPSGITNTDSFRETQPETGLFPSEDLIPGAYYRAWLDPCADEVEFVRFVGFKYAEQGYVFEDATGNLLVVSDFEAA